MLCFVGAGGIGFQLLTAVNLFQYQEVSLLLIIIFVIVLGPSGCQRRYGNIYLKSSRPILRAGSVTMMVGRGIAFHVLPK